MTPGTCNVTAGDNVRFSRGLVVRGSDSTTTPTASGRASLGLMKTRGGVVHQNTHQLLDGKYVQIFDRRNHRRQLAHEVSHVDPVLHQFQSQEIHVLRDPTQRV